MICYTSKITDVGQSMFKSIIAAEIEINHNCNMSCSYCPNSKLERIEKGEMDEKTFRNILSQLNDIGFKGRLSYHFYGEPLLCSNLDYYVSLGKEYLPNCLIVIYTNGTLLTRERLDKLFDLGVFGFIVTKHENSSDSYVFDEVYENLSQDQKEKVQYRNPDSLFLTTRGGLVPRLDNKKVELPLKKICFVPSATLTFTLKGNVLPCFEDYQQRFVMGNINQEHITKIWKSSEYIKFRECLRKSDRTINTMCSQCNSFLPLPF